MTYVIAEPCIDVKDKACIDECPVDCIYEGERMLYIHPGECVGCGACEPVCPVGAIFYEDDVPGQWAQFTAENARFFDQLGSPGGAAKPARCPATLPMSPATSPTGNHVMPAPKPGKAACQMLSPRRFPRQGTTTTAAAPETAGRGPADRCPLTLTASWRPKPPGAGTG